MYLKWATCCLWTNLTQFIDGHLLKIKTDNYGEQHLTTAISFSYSDDSMNYRGLRMMNHFINFDNLITINLSMCNVNGPDGEIPKELNELYDKIIKSDKLVFAIPEYSGHYSVGFKNFMDWLVVKSNYKVRPLDEIKVFFEYPPAENLLYLKILI